MKEFLKLTRFLKLKELLIPIIFITVCIYTATQIFYLSPEARSERRRVRAEEQRQNTKVFLEQTARSEIDFLSKKYDINILQDQLNKNKKRLESKK